MHLVNNGFSITDRGTRQTKAQDKQTQLRNGCVIFVDIVQGGAAKWHSFHPSRPSTDSEVSHVTYIAPLIL